MAGYRLIEKKRYMSIRKTGITQLCRGFLGRVILFFPLIFIAAPVFSDDSPLFDAPIGSVSAPSQVTVRPVPEATDYSIAEKSEFYPSELTRKITQLVKNKSDETQAIAECGEAILNGIDKTVYHLDRGGSKNVSASLELLERHTIRWAALRLDRSTDQSPEVPVPGPVALEEIQLALERYITLWHLAAHAVSVPCLPVVRHYSKTLADVRELKEKTRLVEAWFLEGSSKTKKKNTGAAGDDFGAQWCDYLDTRSFIVELEACEQSVHSPNRRVSTLEPQIPVPMLTSFADRANVILARLEDSVLTDVQQAYLDTEEIRAWRAELQNWTADTVSAAALLQAVTRFEETAGMSDMENLFRQATRQSFSPTPELQRLGMFTRELYGLPNVKLYVSKALINNHLPPMKPETGGFREIIQGQPTQGRRQAESELAVRFLSDDKRLRFSLDLGVNVETNSRSSAFATTLFSSGQAKVEATKEIEFTEAGFQLHPGKVRVVNNRLQLRRFQTDFDRVPVLSGLVRGVVRNQYDARIGGARSETQQKIAREVRSRLDREVGERFEAINERYRGFLENSMDRFGLFLEQKDSKTEEDWLLTSWAIRSQDTLSGNTPAPETLPGSFADLKIHESAINMFVGKLHLDGKSGTVGEIRDEIAEKFNRTEWTEPGDNDDVPIAFADYNPIVVRFVDGKVEISVSLKSLRIGQKTHRDFKVFVRYAPSTDAEGRAVLRRHGVISLIGCPRIGDQIAVRAAFGIIFPEERLFPLTPKVLEENSDFEYLTVGHCRIEKGWFAAALIAKDGYAGIRPASSEATATGKRPLRR